MSIAFPFPSSADLQTEAETGPARAPHPRNARVPFGCIKSSPQTTRVQTHRSVCVAGVSFTYLPGQVLIPGRQAKSLQFLDLHRPSWIKKPSTTSSCISLPPPIPVSSPPPRRLRKMIATGGGAVVLALMIRDYSNVVPGSGTASTLISLSRSSCCQEIQIKNGVVMGNLRG